MARSSQIFVTCLAAALASACATNPPAGEGERQVVTKRVCEDRGASTGSRLSRKICREVEVPVEAEKSDTAGR